MIKPSPFNCSLPTLEYTAAEINKATLSLCVMFRFVMLHITLAYNGNFNIPLSIYRHIIMITTDWFDWYYILHV